MILKLAYILCYLGIHRYKVVNVEFGFGPTDRVTTLQCKKCGHSKVKAGD